MTKIKEKIIYENKNNNVLVIEFDNGFIVRHGLKEMCPTDDKSLAIIYAKGYERGLAEGKKLSEK